MMIDITLAEDTNELVFIGGDFSTEESTRRHQKEIMMAEKGEWKESPTVGVGLLSFLGDDDLDGMRAEIMREFNKDGMTVRSITVSGGNINIDADYV